MKYSAYVLLLVVYTLVVLVFFRGITNFFFQDDFINIYIGWIRNLADIPNIITAFKQYPNNAYRPIPYYLFGNIIIYLFKLNPVATHISLFILHGLNIFLLLRFLRLYVTKSLALLLLLLIFYGLNVLHLGVLYWFSTDYILLGTTFFLLLCLLVLKYERRPDPKHFFLLLFVYILMLLTNESLFLAPLQLFIMSKIFNLKRITKLLYVTIVISIISFIFRIKISGFGNLPDYQFGSFIEIVSLVRWYLLRTINLPEGIKAMDNTSINLIYTGSLVLVICFLKLFKHLKMHWRKINLKLLFFGICWFFILGLPYFLLVHHETAYYLNTAYIGLIIAAGTLFAPIYENKKIKLSILTIVTATCYIVMSYVGVSFLNKTSWLVWRGEIARRYFFKTKNTYPILPQGATVVFTKTKIPLSEIRFALYEDKALQLYYLDPTLKVRYEENVTPGEWKYIISD